MEFTSSAGGVQLQPCRLGDENGGFPLTCIEGKYCNKPETVIKPCLCKSQFCRKCSVGLAVELREKLRPVVAKFNACLMITLTADPKKFDGPKAVWEYIGAKRSMSVLMQYLRRQGVLSGPEWFAALEFHKSGYPHYHAVVNAKYIPHKMVLDGWKLGHVSLSRSKGFQSADHAVNYVTKYVMKPDYIAPEWVLGMESRIRRFSTSRGLLGSTQRRYEETDDKRDYKRRTVGERAAECGKTLKKFEVLGDKWRYLGSINCASVESVTESQSKLADSDALAASFEAWKRGETVEKRPKLPIVPHAGSVDWDERY